MFKQSKVSFGIAVAFGGIFAVSAVAQDATQRIEITGSAIKRIESESSLPVLAISQSDIQRSGATSITELIERLPVMQGFTQATESVGGGGGGFSGASIHGIGENRTLVLLNGRRIASWAGQTLTGAGAAIDLNSIPLAAIERVEVLTDGASSLYGSDAIAGVLNFITRKDLNTGELAATLQMPRGSVGKNRQFSAVKGWGDLQQEGYNLLLALSADRQDQIKATDRNYSKTGVIPFSKDGKNYVFFNGSIRGVPANWETFDSANPDPNAAYDNLGNPYLTKNGNCPAVHVLRSGACRFDYASTIEILPESKRDSLFASFAKQLGKDHILSADLAYNQFKIVSRIAPPPVDMQIPTGSTLYNKYMPGGTDVLDPGSVYGYDLYAYWRGVDVGNRITKDESKAVHFAASLSGNVKQWDYTTSYTHSESKWVESYLGGWLMQNEQDTAIANGSFDPFLEPGKQSAAGTIALDGMQYRGVYKEAKSTLDSIELRGSAEIFKIDGRSAQLGVGVEVRREGVKYDPSEIAMGLVNNIAGDSAQEVPYNVKRNIWGAYAEGLFPVMKELEVNAGVRYDHYSDFGKTVNGKLAARFQPSKGLLFRGSVGTGYRAPSVPQVAAAFQHYGVSANTYGCPTAALLELQKTDPLAKCRPDGLQYDVMAEGNKSLQPEKSTQWTLGLRVEPMPQLSLGADIWSVKIRDRINQLSEEVVMADPAGYLKNFRIFVDPGTHNHYVALYLPNENLGREEYSGIDLDGKFVASLPFGKLTTTLQWTHLFRYNFQRLTGGEYFSNLGAYSDGKVTFDNLIKLTGVLRIGALDNTVAVNYKSGYVDQPCVADPNVCGLVRTVKADGSAGGLVDMIDHRVASYLTVDWQGRYEYDKAWTFTLGVTNLLDRDPPLSIKTTGGHQLGFDNRYTDPRGRTLYGSVAFKF